MALASGGPGEIDMKAQLTRANLSGAHRYLPAAAGPAVRDWLRRALVKGTSNDASSRSSAISRSFRSRPAKGGQFLFAAKAHDATLKYAGNWPAITDIAGDVRIDGARLVIAASAGRVLGAQVGTTRAEIADVRDPHSVLRIDGTAAGPTSEFLTFVARTPIAEWIGHVADDATAAGDGRLALKFDLPLHDLAAVTINGQYRFASNAIGSPACRR